MLLIPLELSTKSKAAIDKYFDRIKTSSRQNGQALLDSDAVSDLRCVVKSKFFSAKIQDPDFGKIPRQVELQYDFGDWFVSCTCSQSDCRHAAAALLALKSATRTQVPESEHKVLEAKLKESLARPLKPEEKHFLRLLNNYYDSVRLKGYQMTAGDLCHFAPGLRDFGWTPLRLWPELPATDLEFWQYLALEITRRGQPVPKFLIEVSNLEGMEDKIKLWQRQMDIAKWRSKLETALQGSQGRQKRALEFRLVIQPEQAQVFYRENQDKTWSRTNANQLRQWGQEYEENQLLLSPEDHALWVTIYRPQDYYREWGRLAYSDSEGKRLLNRILRMSLLVERVVDEAFEPLERPAQPLQFHLSSPQSEQGDYTFKLQDHEGHLISGLLAVLAGDPALYLTDRHVFTGPPVTSLGVSSEFAIPAPALECVEGVQFLSHVGVSMPERIKGLTRETSMSVTLRCALIPSYAGSKVESVQIEISAGYDGGAREYYNGESWTNVLQGQALRLARPKDGLIPIVDRQVLQKIPGMVETMGLRYYAYPGMWRVRVTKNFPDLFVEWMKNAPPQVEFILDEELATLKDEPLAGRVRLAVQEDGVDWFDLKVELDIKDTTLTPEEMQMLLNAKGGYVRLGKKGWRRLEYELTEEEDRQLAKLGLSTRDFTAEPQRLHVLQLADAAAAKFLPEGQVERVRRRAEELKTRVTPDLPAAIKATLRPYQLEGFHFLAYLSTNRFGGILADDMGLGKTLQALTWLAWIRAQPEHQGLPSLVVCPKSVMDNWSSESRRFYPELKVCLWHGEPADALEANRQSHDLVVVNYAQLRSLSPEIAALRWHAVLLDEAQCIKNPDSQTAQAARALKADQHLALTGTPIENRLLDLWSIMQYAMPGILGNRMSFGKRYNAQSDILARQRLAARVRPFVLRRTKGQVARDLPERVEEDLICDIDGEQKSLYQAEYKKARLLLLKLKTGEDLNENRFHILTSLLRLRQICCHPALVGDSFAKTESAKVNALMDLLEPIMEEGHKVLVFSQFVTMLDILKKEIADREWRSFYLAGDTENRGELVTSFQETPGAAVFLISLKAGGFGLNLTAASYVVLFDPWWNPAVENQAIDRTHRIGQVNKVIAYRLLIKNSIEEKIRMLQRHKRAIAEDVLGEESFAKALDLDDLRYLFAEE